MIRHKIEQAVGAYKFGDKSIIPITEDVEGHPINVLLKCLDKPKRLPLEVLINIYPKYVRWSVLVLLGKFLAVDSKVMDVEDANSNAKVVAHRHYITCAMD